MPEEVVFVEGIGAVTDTNKTGDIFVLNIVYNHDSDIVFEPCIASMSYEIDSPLGNAAQIMTYGGGGHFWANSRSKKKIK